MPKIHDRSAGSMLPLFSLPGGEGIGDLGPEAHRHLEWLAQAGFRVWQILPGGPTHGDGSPYAALSGHAGNPLWISCRRLADWGWISEANAEAISDASPTVDYPRVFAAKERCFRDAYARFDRRAPRSDHTEFGAFRDRFGPNWLDDWCRFESLRRAHGGRGWPEWPRDPAAAAPRDRHGEEMRYHAFVQYAFYRQWDELRRRAADRGIEFVGDIPFYPALDSADVWSRPHLFRLSQEGRPEAVAGVPPDYFSEDGQLWGNPVYRWDREPAGLLEFWEERLRSALRLADTVRLDHFRAFVAYWEVPAGDETARNGRWVPGPGESFFLQLRERLGGLPFIAEDLGDITEDVDRLRDRFDLAGMQIFQFGFGDDDSSRRHTQPVANSVRYTGTHDNDTIRGWFESLDGGTRDRVRRELSCDDLGVVKAAVDRVLAAESRLAVIPVQDLLGYGSEARINTPGTSSGNWRWRLSPGVLSDALAGAVRRRLGHADRLATASGS